MDRWVGGEEPPVLTEVGEDVARERRAEPCLYRVCWEHPKDRAREVERQNGCAEPEGDGANSACVQV